MSMRKSEKWLLVQWEECDSREVVSANDVNPPGEAKVGCVVHILSVDGAGDPRLKKATIIGSSRDRELLANQISPVKLYEDPIAGPSGYGAFREQRELDFSASETEWAPSEESCSEESEVKDEVENRGSKRVKLQKFLRSYTKNKGKEIRPCNRVPALNTSAYNRKRKLERNNNRIYRKSVADSTNIPAANSFVQVSVQDILNMKKGFDDIAALITEMRKSFPGKHEKFKFPVFNVKSEMENNIENPDHNESFDGNRSDESNRSEDNVLITNKYNIANGTKRNNPKTPVLQDQNHQAGNNEWIHIGSGQTLIHEDQYRKINFATYSKATRTLLRAFFSRRILATHSLTGKGSPAFKNKPAKTCLDPKIVSDIIIEVSKKFNIRESFVRSIITTTCADEAKMFREKSKEKETQKQTQRKTDETEKLNKVRRQIKRSKSVDDQENVAPEVNRINND